MGGVEGVEEMGEREQKDKPKWEGREDLVGEGGWRGDTRERDIGGKKECGVGVGDEYEYE
jgi:hypothetical protein